MSRRVKNTLLLLALALLPGYFLFQSGGSVPDSIAAADSFVRESLPMARQMEQLELDLRLMAGQREQNGIFISENGLMKKLDPPNQAAITRNTAAILDFADRLTMSSNGKKHTYLALLPTAAGVLQQELPRFAGAEMADQQRLIEEIYNGFSGTVLTADVYSALQNRRDQYIYYRTDNSLTALGGYHAYTAIARRLEITNRSLSQFDIEYVNHAYYGDLYQRQPGTVGGWEKSTAPYRRVQPDTLALFRYSGNREYMVTQSGGGERKVYHTLYPLHRMELGPSLDIYLGGSAAVTDIRCSSPGRLRLLVFGDEASLACMPFLANHYQQVTLVNLALTSPADRAGIQPELYDQVLFAYGIESYIHTRVPALADDVRWETEG